MEEIRRVDVVSQWCWCGREKLALEESGVGVRVLKSYFSGLRTALRTGRCASFADYAFGH